MTPEDYFSYYLVNNTFKHLEVFFHPYKKSQDIELTYEKGFFDVNDPYFSKKQYECLKVPSAYDLREKKSLITCQGVDRSLFFKFFSRYQVEIIDKPFEERMVLTKEFLKNNKAEIRKRAEDYAKENPEGQKMLDDLDHLVFASLQRRDENIYKYKEYDKVDLGLLFERPMDIDAQKKFLTKYNGVNPMFTSEELFMDFLRAESQRSLVKKDSQEIQGR